MTPQYERGYQAAERDIQRGITRQPSAYRGAEYIAGYQDARLDARTRLASAQFRAAIVSTWSKEARTRAGF
jgi:hypothetical protein